jgi:hypothetical protein
MFFPFLSGLDTTKNLDGNGSGTGSLGLTILGANADPFVLDLSTTPIYGLVSNSITYTLNNSQGSAIIFGYWQIG